MFYGMYVSIIFSIINGYGPLLCFFSMDMVFFYVDGMYDSLVRVLEVILTYLQK